jgi:DNA processing protein
MNDLYCFSQLLKKHPLYSLSRDSIQARYRKLALEQNLTCHSLRAQLVSDFPELENYFQLNQSQYDNIAEEVERCRQEGHSFVTYGEDLYPIDCYLMQESPLTLSYWGSAAWIDHPGLAVVGSREPADLSLRWMEKELSEFCEARRVCVVSGGARGVDQKAHSLALRKKSPTIVVLPSGLNCLYPNSLVSWIDSVLQEGGCFLSEYPPSQVMHKYLFHHRNRLIAALGKCTLLVEARRQSGTLITAQQALQLGRAVGVVPGHPLDPHFGGSVDLLADGAFLVRDAQDLASFFNTESEAIKLSDALVGVDL